MSEPDDALIAYDRQLEDYDTGRLDLADLLPHPVPNRLPMKCCVKGGIVRVSREAMEVFAGGPTDMSTASIYLEHGDAIDARCEALIAQGPRPDRRYEMDAGWARGG